MRILTATLCMSLLLIGTACQNADPSAELVEARQQIADLEAQLSEAGQMTAPGFVHTVFFWLKEDVTEEQREAFERGLAIMHDIETIQSMYFGRPAMTPRDVVDNSYDYGLTMFFANAADQDAYQQDSIHKKMIEQHEDIWERVQVYDFTVE